MARFFSVLFLILATAFNSGAQTRLNSRQYEDSLLADLQRQGTDSAKAMTYFRLAEHVAQADAAAAERYLSAGRLAGSRTPIVQANYHYYYAYLLSLRDPAKAETLYLLADSLLTPFETPDAWLMRSKALHRYGVLRHMHDDPKQFAEIMINRAIPLARRAGDSSLISKNYLGIGHLFKNHGQFNVAETYILTALQTIRNSRDAVEQRIFTYNTLAENYSLAGKNDLVKPILDTIYTLLTPYPDSDYWLDYYAAESLHYNNTREYTKALAGLDVGVPLARRLGRRYEEQRLLLQRFYALYETQQYTGAGQVMTYLLAQPEITRMAPNRLLLFAGMADTQAKLGNARSAYEWQKRYSALSDSLSDSRLKGELNAMEVKFRNAENLEKITRLEAEQQKAALAGRNTRLTMWLLAVVSVLLIAAVIFTIFYNRNNKKLAAQEAVNYRQQLKEMQQQQQLATSHAMIEGEERERTRVARDLHDGLGGMLAGVKIKLSGIAANGSEPDTHSQLNGVISQLDSSVTELRRIARNMMPENLLKFGLETALRDLAGSLSSPITPIDFQAFNIDRQIPVSTQVTIYRIVQEALSNAVRHAAATEVLLQCSQNGEAFFITIEDNGKGFDMQRMHEHTGTGLHNIRNRVNYLNGLLDIVSAPGEGTTIHIELLIHDES